MFLTLKNIYTVCSWDLDDFAAHDRKFGRPGTGLLVMKTNVKQRLFEITSFQIAFFAFELRGHFRSPFFSKNKNSTRSFTAMLSQLLLSGKV